MRVSLALFFWVAQVGCVLCVRQSRAGLCSLACADPKSGSGALRVVPCFVQAVVGCSLTEEKLSKSWQASNEL
jgi:hypothetical protein